MYQPIESVTFDSMPNAVSKLMKEVDEMKEMLQTIAERVGRPQKSNTCQANLPDRPSIPGFGRKPSLTTRQVQSSSF